MCFIRRARYALSEPKASLTLAYIKQLQRKQLDDDCFKAKLCKRFVRVHKKVARGVSEYTVANTACRTAAEEIVYCALEECKNSAGKLLSCVRSVNSKRFPPEGFGVSYHTASFETWFYDTAYKLVKHQSVIYSYRQCARGLFIAKPVKGSEKRSPKHKCGAEIQPNCGAFFTKWECTAECRPLTDEQVTSIAETKL